MEGIQLLGISKSRVMVPVLTSARSSHGYTGTHGGTSLGPWQKCRFLFPPRPLESENPCGQGVYKPLCFSFPIRTVCEKPSLEYDGWWRRTKVTGQKEFKKLRSWSVQMKVPKIKTEGKQEKERKKEKCACPRNEDNGPG